MRSVRRIPASANFVLVSSKDFTAEEILPYYYKRQENRALFDVCKKLHKDFASENTPREKRSEGHLILTFMASVVCRLIAMQMQRKSWGRINLIANENAADKPVRRGRKPQFKPPEFNRMGMFKRLRNQKCNVYGSKVVPAVPYKPANDVSSFF